MKRRTKQGFSMPEVVTVAGLVGLISTGVMGFFIQSLKNSNASEQQLQLLSDMRSFMDEMVFNGSRSHEFILYNSTAAADRTSAGRKVVLNSENEADDDDICPTGNFAVFVYYELPKPADQDHYRIQKLVGYYLDKHDSGPPALVRMTIDLSSNPSTETVEEVLNDNWSSASRMVIGPRVTPLALSDGYTDQTTPQLFYMRASQNLAVCGQLLQSTARVDTRDSRTQTRTFYFTVTVRS